MVLCLFAADSDFQGDLGFLTRLQIINKIQYFSQQLKEGKEIREILVIGYFHPVLLIHSEDKFSFAINQEPFLCTIVCPIVNLGSKIFVLVSKGTR